jgi:protein subunit release factor A
VERRTGVKVFPSWALAGFSRDPPHRVALHRVPVAVPASAKVRFEIRSTLIVEEALMSIIVEIRAAEGGDDAKLLVLEQLRIYRKRCERRGL